MGATAAISWTLSRFAFLMTHVSFGVAVNMLLNDPFDLGLVSLDAKQRVDDAVCERFNQDAIKNDVIWFALWWGSHSILAREAVKKALGLWESPLERPIFAAIASVMWLLNSLNWQPISNCASEFFDVYTLELTPFNILRILVVLAGVFEVLSLLYSLPDHVFGTAKYKYLAGKLPAPGLITKLPYNIVRHPAAAGFLWAFWAYPSYTTNHIFFAGMWTVFIIVGTLVLEESGIRSDTSEFGCQYKVYAQKIGSLYPTPFAIKRLFGLATFDMDAEMKKANSKSK